MFPDCPGCTITPLRLFFVLTIGVVIFSFVTTLLVTPLYKFLAVRFSILDQPDGKLKVHAQPTPYLGGLAVFTGFVVTLAICSYWSSIVFPFSFFAGLFCLVLVGLYDDIRTLTPLQKFIGQIIACCFFIAGGFSFNPALFDFVGSPIIAQCMAVVFSLWWYLAIINAFNLIDIMDGLATGIALVSSLFFMIILFLVKFHPFFLLLLFLWGPLSAFFLFNRPKASIYLGDTGSLLLGGFLGAAPFSLSCWGPGATLSFSLVIPLLVCMIPALELCFLMGIRYSKGLPVYYGSPHHFVHYLKRKGWSVKKILALAILFQAFFGICALFVAFSFFSPFVVMSIVALLLFFWVFLVYY